MSDNSADTNSDNNSNDYDLMRRELIQIKQNDRAELYANVEHAIGITALRAGNAIRDDDLFRLAECQELMRLMRKKMRAAGVSERVDRERERAIHERVARATAGR